MHYRWTAAVRLSLTFWATPHHICAPDPSSLYHRTATHLMIIASILLYFFQLGTKKIHCFMNSTSYQCRGSNAELMFANRKKNKEKGRNLPEENKHSPNDSIALWDFFFLFFFPPAAEDLNETVAGFQKLIKRLMAITPPPRNYQLPLALQRVQDGSNFAEDSRHACLNHPCKTPTL